jgi:rSAM/selenodomain-associated transferase 2
MSEIKYTIVIISYNEENNILACVNSIKTARNDVQIILSDGGSTDSTIKIADDENVEIISSKAGRGIQCNTGAVNAKGNIILFLHSDSTLPINAFEILDEYFYSDKIKIGTFRLEFDKNNPILSFYTKFTSIDSLFTRFGDQCIVVRKDFFKELNGFKDWSLYEDVDFLRRARKLAKIYSFPASVVTSSRRFEEKGIIRQQFFNAWLFLQYLFGKSPENLAAKYNSLRKENKPKAKPEIPVEKNKDIVPVNFKAIK